jgi:hypothetical protein
MTMQATTKQSDTQKYAIQYGNHDKGANGGQMIREGLERAEWSANLMKECGYQTVVIEKV